MKTEAKVAHTPGPWKATEETYPSIAGDVTIYSTVTCDCIASLPKPWTNKTANAQLIAAAPEMLELLHRLCEWSWGQHYTVREADIWKDVDALKAKIDGGAA